MQSPVFFIATPKGGQYVNSNDSIIRNVSIEEAKDVNRIGIVKSIPTVYKTVVDVGDEIVVHHNTFRITFDVKGVPVHSNSYIKDDLYFIYPEMIYMVIKPNGDKISLDPFCFVEPLVEEGADVPNIGILKYGNKFTEEIGIEEGTNVLLKDYSNYEFNFDNERLYRVRNNQLLGTC